jgi:hypothetical protein
MIFSSIEDNIAWLVGLYIVLCIVLIIVKAWGHKGK